MACPAGKHLERFVLVSCIVVSCVASAVVLDPVVDVVVVAIG